MLFSSRSGLDSSGLLPFWVTRKYSIIAPIEDISALVKLPSPSMVSMSKVFFMRSLAELLSKEELPSSETLIPNSSARFLCSSANSLDNRISVGESLANSEPSFPDCTLEI